MTHFPVYNSNLSASHLAIFLREKYNLGDDSSCRILRSGINDTYLIKSNTKKYVFRIYSLNWRSRVEIEEEIRLLTLLKEEKIPVSYPITDIKENYIQVLNAPEGERFGVLFSFAEGEKEHILSEEAHYNIGCIMARFHKATEYLKLKRITYTPEVLLVDSLKKIEPFLSSESEEMKFMRSTQKFLLEELAKADVSKIRKGAVHLDIWCDNLNITKDEKVTVFDFDFCGNGWLCLDFAYYILQLNNTERGEKVCEAKVDSFLKGYRSITKISEEEMRLIPMLGVSIYFFYLGIQCERFDNWSNSFLSENYLKRFINGLIKRYYDMKGLENNERSTS